MTTTTTKPDYRNLAACRGTTETGFFIEDDDEPLVSPKVAAICGRCRIKDDCLTWALDHPDDTDGAVYGGKTPRQRRELIESRHRVHCPGCGANGIIIERGGEECLGCGLHWVA